MNWGYRITILFSAFVVLILFMVNKAFKTNVDLVSDDYYEKEIKYQEQIDKINNAGNLKDLIACSQNEKELVINFANMSNSSKGEIFFFRPSDQSRDFKKTIAIDNNKEQHIDKNNFTQGYYKVQIDWETGGKKYFVEKEIFIQ
jgi:hypothetical protein